MHQLCAHVARHPRHRDALAIAAAESLCDRRGTKGELRLRLEDGQLDSVSRQITQGQECLEAGDPAARNQDPKGRPLWHTRQFADPYG
jgi:hypothetical protein